MRIPKIIITLTACVALCFATAVPSSAVPVSSIPESGFVKSKLAWQENRTINEQSAAVTNATDSATHTFNLDESLDNGLEPSVADETAQVFIENGWNVISSNQASDVTQVQLRATGCSGRSGYTGYWWPWGYQYALNSCQTSKLISAVGLGAAGAGVVTAIVTAAGGPVGGIPGIVTAILTFGTAALQMCSAASTPKYAIYLNLNGHPIVSCWGQ